MIRPLLLLLALAALGGCDGRLPGKPLPSSRWQPASATTDFSKLFEQNCRGCHGLGDIVAPSIALDNPTFLSVIPRADLVRIISDGVPAAAMPGFAASAGGGLTEQQITILADGLLSRKPVPAPAQLPPFAADLGDVASGATAFAAACATCHGADGNGGDKAGSVVTPAYLDLASDQYLRTIVIAGRPDLGCPNFADRIPGRAMTDAEIADVTAWLVSHRRNEFGEPLTPATPTQP